VLLALVERGLTREEAYAVVQRSAMRCWERGTELAEELLEEEEVRAVMTEAELAGLFDPSWYVRHVDELMERVAAL
jgi:adenylosuccinate lyase